MKSWAAREGCAVEECLCARISDFVLGNIVSDCFYLETVLAERGRMKHTSLLVAEPKLRKIPGWIAELQMFVYILLEKEE